MALVELTTHTLQLMHDNTGSATAILVGSGPKTNIDMTARVPSSGRSQVRLFHLDTSQPIPLKWTDGVVVAYGIRNPAGFTFVNGTSSGLTAANTLLIVDNGASIDNVTGVTFANDNPADEINRVTLSPNETLPPYFGFPDCSTLWNPEADPTGVPQYATFSRGAQFSFNLSTISSDSTGPRNDVWCQNVTNNQPPVFNFQASRNPFLNRSC